MRSPWRKRRGTFSRGSREQGAPFGKDRAAERRSLPSANGSLLADDPQVDLVVLAIDRDGLGLLGLPRSHQEAMGDNARARLELFLEDRAELLVEVVAQVEHDHAGVAQVLLLHHVAFTELDLVRGLRLLG